MCEQEYDGREASVWIVSFTEVKRKAVAFREDELACFMHMEYKNGKRETIDANRQRIIDEFGRVVGVITEVGFYFPPV